MNDKTNRSLTATVALLGIAAVLWMAVLAVLVIVVPRYERVFRDQGRRLPAPTLATIAAGRWADNYWYVLPLFGLMILPVIVLLSWLLRHKSKGSVPGWFWLAVMVGLPLVLQLGIWVTLQMP